jgi:hypothetical protein
MAEESTVTIRAEMLDDVSGPARRARESVRGLGEAVRSAGGGSAATDGLGRSMESTAKKVEGLSGTSSKASKSMKDLTEHTGKLKESLGEFGSTVTEKVKYPLQQLSYTLEAVAAGIVTFGLVTASSMQTASLQLSNFTGSAAVGLKTAQALRALSGPSSMAGLETGYESLSASGMSGGQDLSTLTKLNNLAATRGGDTALATLTSIFSSSNMSGRVSGSQIQALAGMGLPAYQLAAQASGTSTQALRQTLAINPGAEFASAGILPGILNAQGSQTGKSQYTETWAGQLDEVKKSFGSMLAVLETPLGNALDGAGKKVDTWATGVESRFKTMGGGLGEDLSTGNMSAFGTSLATIFGDPKLAGMIATVAKTLDGLAHIISGSVVPAGEAIAKAVTPALTALSDVIEFMGQHKSTTEALIVSLVGLEVVSKVGKGFQLAASSFKLFSDAMTKNGLAAVIENLTKKLLGLEVAEDAVGKGKLGALAKTLGLGGETAASAGAAAATGEATTAATVAGSAAEAGSAVALGGAAAATGAVAGGAALVGLLGYGVYSGLNPSSINPFAARDESLTPQITAKEAQTYGADAKAAASLQRMGTTIKQLNISVAGSGSPEQVANAVPKALQDKLRTANQKTQRRAGP